jgi:hypothetical protein
MTDAAALFFLAEDAVLAGQEDAETVYLERFLPVKVAMQIDCLRHKTFIGDLRILVRTMTVVWSRRARDESAIAMQSLLEDNPPPSREGRFDRIG